MKTKPQDNANSLVEQQLEVHLDKLEELLDGDVLVYDGPITHGVDDLIRDAIEGKAKRCRKLVFILETPGGLADVTERIAHTLRKFYRRVEFIVPNYAMSAGTLLVMSGDAIHMDYYSILGPIDPQIGGPSGNLIPVNGYLKKYAELVAKSKDKTITTAELNYFISNFDSAELYRFEQEMALSVTLLKKWLVKYKFRDWKRTKTRRLLVTAAMRRARAEDIGKKLNDTDRWHIHGRGIPMAILTRELKLEIDDLEKNKPLWKELRLYAALLDDYTAKVGVTGSLHMRGLFVPIGRRS